MQLDDRFVKVAHDPGDPVLCSHCPFCGSGQITGRSDGGIDCAFCGQSFIVRVQPAFPGMPQAPGMGAPTDIGPDMMGGMGDPMMEGGEMPPGEEEEGMPPGAEGDEDEGFPPGGGDEEDEGAPPFGGGGDEGASDSGGPPPPSKGKGKGDKGKPKKESARRYRTMAGDELTEDQYVRHLAILHSGLSPIVIRLVRHEAAMPRTANLREHLRSHHPDYHETPYSDPYGEHDRAHEWGEGGRPKHEHAFPEGHTSGDILENPGEYPNWGRYQAAKGDPVYNGHYNRGWRSSQNPSERGGSSPLERADDRREPDAWYDGYLDYATSRPKFHSRDCHAPDHDAPGCTLWDKTAASVIPAREYEPGYNAEQETQDWMNELRSKRRAGPKLDPDDEDAYRAEKADYSA